MSVARGLILFDIDGTLLKCGPQVKAVFAGVLEEVFGTTGAIDSYDFAGKTDHQILHDLLGPSGVSPEALETGLPRARALYGERLERDLDRDRMLLLPGVHETLEWLRRDPTVTLGLLTGNWQVGARIKLGRFDLNGYFAFGAFGDGVMERRQLPPRALAAARLQSGYDFSARETLIVGDTLLDVDCARAHGIASLAVATGSTSEESLRGGGADWVAADLASAALPPIAFA